MGKTNSDQKRAKRREWLDDRPDDDMKKAVQMSTAEYVDVNKVDLFTDKKPSIKLKDLRKIIAKRDLRWLDIESDDINTSKHRAMKNLNDTLNNLLINKQKLAKLVMQFREEPGFDSSESSSSEHSVHEADLKNNETVIAEESEPKQS